MRRVVLSKKMMLAAFVLLPALHFTRVNAQEPLVLDLDKALEIAMSENPTVRVANREIEKKEYAKKGSYAALFPQVNFGFDYTRTLKKQVMYMDFDMSSLGLGGESGGTTGEEASSSSDDGFPVGRDNNWSVGFNASMPLINASLWKSIAISGQDVELAVEQARSSRIDLVNQVSKAYYAILLANDSYKVYKESYDNAMENYLDIKQKYEQGTVAEYDLIRADVTVKNAEPNMLQAENALKLVKWQLKALMGIDLDLPIECEGALVDYKSDLFGDFLTTSSDTSLDENTTLKQIDIQFEQLGNSLKMQKFDFLPTLSLTGLYNWSSMNNNFKFGEYKWNPYSTIGVSLSIPIFSGGSKVQKIRQTKVSMLQMELQREDTERNLQLSVRQSLDNMTTCVKRFHASQRGVEQAERGYLISQKRYDTGAGTLLEMNDAELAMTQAKLNFNQAIYDYMTAKSDLEKTLGKQAN